MTHTSDALVLPPTGGEMKLWKVLDHNGRACHGGTGRWHLPAGGKPGAWMPMITNPIPCQWGYHLCRAGDLIKWLGPTLYEAEARGTILPHEDKLVVSEARLLRCVTTWNDTTAQLLTADCAEHVLPVFEACYPQDGRPRAAIAAARAFARGEINTKALTAALDAALDAAQAAAMTARDAAGVAAWAAWVTARADARAAARAAAQAAWAAALEAAQAARAAWDTAGVTEQRWQTQRLMKYLYPTGEQGSD